MKEIQWKRLASILPACLMLAAAPLQNARAADDDVEGRCVVIHVPQDDPGSLIQAVNIASNLPRQLGADGAYIELLAQGPGLKLLEEGSPETGRIQSLIALGEQTLGGGIAFKACGATIAGIKAKTGRDVRLIDGVTVTYPGAAVRAMELQEKGCSYLRP